MNRLTKRPAEPTSSEQDYLKTIYELTAAGQRTTTNALAEKLGVAPASVTNMLQKMAATIPSLVEYTKHQGVVLTEGGRLAALEVMRRHRLLETFLMEIMGYSLDEVHLEAEDLEHAVSARFVRRMSEMLGEPQFDPHGDPIPAEDLVLPVQELMPLSMLPTGLGAVIRRIKTMDIRLLRYLDELGLVPGCRVKVIRTTVYDGLVHLRVNDMPEIVLGAPLTSLIWVEMNPPK